MNETSENSIRFEILSRKNRVEFFENSKTGIGDSGKMSSKRARKVEGKNGIFDRGGSVENEFPKSYPRKKRKFLTLQGEESRTASYRVIDHKSLENQSRIDGEDGKTEKAEKKTGRAKVKVERVAKAREKRKADAKKKRRTRGAVKIGNLENLKSSKIFTPSPEDKAEMRRLLNLSPNSKFRRELVARMGAEFVRQYVRWRKINDPYFKLHGSEEKFGAQGAVLAFERGITPEQLIRYWAAHIHKFRLRYAPLHFVAAAANIDAAASFYSLNGPKADPAKIEDSKGSNVAAGLHGYADTNALHPELRGGLVEAGHDVGDWSDRELMTVQNAAKAIAGGRDLFVSSRLRPLVDWAIKLFRKKGGEHENRRRS